MQGSVEDEWQRLKVQEALVKRKVKTEGGARTQRLVG